MLMMFKDSKDSKSFIVLKIVWVCRKPFLRPLFRYRVYLYGPICCYMISKSLNVKSLFYKKMYVPFVSANKKLALLQNDIHM